MASRCLRTDTWRHLGTCVGRAGRETPVSPCRCTSQSDLTRLIAASGSEATKCVSTKHGTCKTDTPPKLSNAEIKRVMVSSYIAQYPVLMIAQSTFMMIC